MRSLHRHAYYTPAVIPYKNYTTITKLQSRDTGLGLGLHDNRLSTKSLVSNGKVMNLAYRRRETGGECVCSEVISAKIRVT